jgi:hypothetical protein
VKLAAITAIVRRHFQSKYTRNFRQERKKAIMNMLQEIPGGENITEEWHCLPQYGVEKSTGINSVKSQRALFFTVTAMMTLNLKIFQLFPCLFRM